MKFPSLTRLPSHKRFTFEPRYYDPVKEDIAERTSRIKQETSQLHEVGAHRRSNISGAFSRNSNREASDKRASIIQLVLVFFFIALFGGYLLYGNSIFYIFLLILPVYVYFRLKKFSKRRE